MRVRFHGAAGEVTGSCHEVEFAGGRRLLLDCGMIQGSARDELRNRDPFPFDVASLDGVVLSHAHIDHCGRLPVLVARGFAGPIWTHPATADLLRIMLADAASLAERDAELDNRHRRDGRADHAPLFTSDDVARTLKQVRAVPYDPVAWACAAAIGVGLPAALIAVLTEVQRRTPGPLLGRVTAVLRSV